MEIVLRIPLLLQLLSVSHGNDVRSGISAGCETPQYLSLGKMGIIKCIFQDFYSIFWYNSTDSETKTPLVALKGTTKSGDGYLSGKFDVLLNGSFIIDTVSEQNDHFYRVLVVHNKEGVDYETHDIRVYVTVMSQQYHPYIDICGRKPFCFVQLTKDYKLGCSVTGTRPAANLAWILRDASGDQNISLDLTVSFHNTLYKTESKTLTHFEGATFSVLLVCKVFGPPNIISVSESMVLVENMNMEYPYMEEQMRHVKIGEPLKLSPVGSVRFIAWKKKSADGVWTSVLNVYFGGQIYSKIYLNEYTFYNDGSLLVSHVGIDTEGTYMCVYNDDEKDSIEVFKVIVFDDTQSDFSSVWIILVVLVLIIVMVVGSAIYILRKWKERQKRNTSPAQTPEKESLLPDSEQPSTVDKKVPEQTHKETQNLPLEKSPVSAEKTCDDGSFKMDNTDSSMIAETSQTRPSHTEDENKGMEVLEMQPQQLKDPKPSTKVEAMQSATEEPETETRDKATVQPQPEKERENTTPTIPSPAEEGEHGEHNQTNGTEENPADEVLPEKVLASEEKGKMLEEELLVEYKSMYKLLPRPGTSEEKCGVNEFFVHLPLDFSKRSGSASTAIKFVQQVPTHHHIFENEATKSTRYILTGKQGYGKTTLALQMACEWCEKREQTYMKNYKIFILLNLAALKSFDSLKQVIKRVLLSKSQLSEEDIQEAIENYSKGLIVMLGYHKFHDDKEQEDSEFAKIVTGKSLSNFDVMLITTSSGIPQYMDFDVPVIELKGFEEETQMKYIQKRLGDRMPSVADDMREAFKKNPALQEICHIPMFFTFYVEIYKQQNAEENISKLRKTVLQSVTEFVQKVLFSLEAPVKNMRQKEKYDKIKETLEIKAFDGLSTSSSRKICWDIEDIASDPVEIDFCKGSGFLVFDEVGRTSQKTSHGKIAFRHSIFLEWYAAKSQLATNSINNSKPGTWAKVFSNSSPFLKYFLFGLHKNSSNLSLLIIDLEKNQKEVPMICFLELQATALKKKMTEKFIEIFLGKCIEFCKNDSKLYQSSASLFLGAISEKKEVAVSMNITDCLKCDDCSEEHLSLESGVKIQNLPVLTKLDITLTGQVLEGAKAVPILEYASKCHERLHVKFQSCFLAESYVDESLLEKLSEAKVKVEWAPGIRGKAALILNHETGRWEEKNGSTEITPERYKDMEQKFKQKIKK